MKTLLPLALAFLLAPVWAADLTLGPGETLDWSTLDPAPTKSDTLTVTGGTIANLSGDVPCRINVGGEAMVHVAAGETPRLTGKVVRTAEGGRLVFDGTVKVHGVNTAWAFIDDGVLAFAAGASDAKVVFEKSSYASMRTMPQFWGLPVEYLSGSTEVAFGAMPAGTETLTVPQATTGRHTLRLTGPSILPAETAVVVPANTICNFQPMTLNATTFGATTTDNGTTQTFANDVRLDGGVFRIGARVPVTVSGAFTGAGQIEVEAYANGKNVRARTFSGSLEDLSADSTLTVLAPENYGENDNNYSVRVKSGFPGTVVLQGDCETNIVSFGVADLQNTGTAVLVFGAIDSKGQVYPSQNATLRGALLQFNQGQHWQVGRLSGAVGVSSSQNTPSVLEVAEIADDADIWIRYGVILKVGSVGRNVRLHYMPNSNRQVNSVEQTGPGAFAEIEIQGTANTVVMDGVAAESVTGGGTLQVTGGACRFGTVADGVHVDVQAGSVRFGAVTDLASVVAAQAPALWLDASATARMVGAWNAGWAKSTAGKKVLAANPKVMFNGEDTATFDGHPLIEKWFDRRPDQNKTYGWQYRNFGYGSTLYTLVYPYLVENGLNGKPYMSFGTMGGTIDTETYGLAGTTSEAVAEERRRMPLMEGTWKNEAEGKDWLEGHAIRAGTAVLVFGSQNGGGRGLLGGYQSSGSTIAASPNGRKTGELGVLDTTHDPACSHHHPRGGTSADTTAATPIFKDSFETWLDGVSVDPTTTGFNGGWQVVSFNGNREFVRSLGMSTRYAYAGGQNYAEILVFPNELASGDRQAVEEYLSLKWGIAVSGARSGNVTVAKGALVSGRVSGVSGDGVVLARTETGARLEGALNLVSDGTALLPSLCDQAGTLELPASLTVNVDLAKPLASDAYVIASAESLTGVETVAVNVTPSAYTAKVRKDGSALVLQIGRTGLTILIR